MSNPAYNEGPPSQYYGFQQPQQQGVPQNFQQTQYGVAPQESQQYPLNVQMMPGQTIVVPVTVFRDVPVTIPCPYCSSVVTTRLIFHATCVGYLLVGLWALCCECVQNVEHVCPNCNKSVGLYERFPC